METPKGKHAWSVTVGTKGQIVIPAEAREIFNIRPGDTLVILGDDKRGLAIPPKAALSGLFKHTFGGGTQEGSKNGDT